MINFFRKIRRKLADDKKPLKYLRYAIGEIVLVVIGILIAIQLNNYNEQKIAERNGIELLSKLKIDLNNDIEYFDTLSGLYDTWLIQSRTIVNTTLAGKFDSLVKLEQYVAGQGSLKSLLVNKVTYDKLYNSDNRNQIRNIDLNNSINDYYQYAEIELKKLNSENEQFLQWMVGNINLNLWERLKSKRNLEYEDWSWLQDPTSVEYKKLETWIGYYVAALKANQDLLTSLKQKSKNLIGQIESEIDL